MKQRIITALILAPLVVWGIFSLPFLWFMIAVAAITLIGAWEWTQFTLTPSRLVAMLPPVIAIALSVLLIPVDVIAFNQVGLAHITILGVGCSWWLIASGLAMTYPKSANYWQHSNLLRHLFGLLTLLPFLWSILILRAQAYHQDPYHGAKLVLFVCLIVWAADSGAYFAGKSLGKRKMAPHVSPNKTIEGLLGGIVTALGVAWGSSIMFDIEFTSATSMVFITLATVVISVLGDLVESMFKRVSKIKDSSNIIPGHGGVLDRVDSLTAAFPIFALLYLIF
ncbi:phosphatidate cytidylyltransferase [Vibrio sp. ZSDZ65]|uniref:Phosphatidate cytidylyltransferase n=1 Tax=Vibrio qingdaonensis TaxID=2829491 RepID=A0A9X3CMJ3_9VIBR|nr:phosphatidate cytidylyltransferase [Vibrio qingdaonensis]MCW8346128.1 phosphatidate cytidylyltransferase [Vibrio qingdaonensis]